MLVPNGSEFLDDSLCSFTVDISALFRHWAMSRDQVPFDPKNRGEPIDFSTTIGH